MTDKIMTEEKAIELFKEWDGIFRASSDDVNAALNMAIDAIKFKQKADAVIELLRADRDRLATALEEIEEEIREWQMDIHDNEYNAEGFDFVFDRIYEILDKHRKGGKNERNKKGNHGRS